MASPFNSRSRFNIFAPAIRTLVIFAILLSAWGAYELRTPLGQPGYLLVFSYNIFEPLRPPFVDYAVFYWWFFPVYLYVLAVALSWILSRLDEIGDEQPH